MVVMAAVLFILRGGGTSMGGGRGNRAEFFAGQHVLKFKSSGQNDKSAGQRSSLLFIEL